MMKAELKIKEAETARINKEILVLRNRYIDSNRQFADGTKVQIKRKNWYDEKAVTEIGFVKDYNVSYGASLNIRLLKCKKDGTASSFELGNYEVCNLISISQVQP